MRGDMTASATACPALESTRRDDLVITRTDRGAIVSTMRRKVSNCSSSLGGSLRRFETQIANSDERLAAIAEQQEALRERLTRDFVASERRVAASQSTLTFLRQQVDIWSNSDR